MCSRGAYDGHELHCEDDDPLQVRQLLSQLWQTLSESAKVPAGQEATQAVPCLYCLDAEHVTQSELCGPVQVPQSEWQATHNEPNS